MADAKDSLIYTLGVTSGIKRDGTTFEAREFSDGTWCRFQRGVPKKMGGYRQMFREPNGIPRGMITNPYDGVNYMFLGTSNTLDVFTSSTNLGIGAGPYVANLPVTFQADERNLWQFDLQYDPQGEALKVLAHPGLNLNNIDNGVESPVFYGSVLPNSSEQWTMQVLADSSGQNPTYQAIAVDGGVCVLYPFIFAYFIYIFRW